MIQKKMSGDITKMESKILFGYTPRQVVCSIVALAVAFVGIIVLIVIMIKKK